MINKLIGRAEELKNASGNVLNVILAYLRRF